MNSLINPKYEAYVCGWELDWCSTENVINFSDSATTQRHVSNWVNQLMLYREIITVCSEIHTKHINTVWVDSKIC